MFKPFVELDGVQLPIFEASECPLPPRFPSYLSALSLQALNLSGLADLTYCSRFSGILATVTSAQEICVYEKQHDRSILTAFSRVVEDSRYDLVLPDVLAS